MIMAGYRASGGEGERAILSLPLQLCLVARPHLVSLVYSAALLVALLVRARLTHSLLHISNA